MVADDPTNKIDLKTFYYQIQNNHESLPQEEQVYQEIAAARAISPSEILRNYQRIKTDIHYLIEVKAL